MRLSLTRGIGATCLWFALLGSGAGAYAFDAWEILRADPDGANVETVLPRETSRAGWGVVFDPHPVYPRMYWLAGPRDNYYLLDVLRATPDGQGITEILGAEQPIAIDSVNNKIYVTFHSDCEPCSSIARADLDGSDLEFLVGDTVVSGLAIDTVGGKMYWSGYSRIWRANLDGTQEEEFLSVPDYVPTVTIDVQARMLYWAGHWTGKIQRALLDSPVVEDLVTDLDHPWGLAVDSAGDRMWWSEEDAGTIRRARLDGSEVTDVLTGLDQPLGVAYLPGDGKIYFLANPGEVEVEVPATSPWGTIALVVLIVAGSTALLTRR